ncbi:hypothetical protein BDV12DRAFT_193958 [Aspergillus spectabilis]
MSPPSTQEWANLFKSKDFARSYKRAEQLTGVFADPLIDQSRITSYQPETPPIVLDNACGTGIISSVLNHRLSDQVRQDWKLTCGDFSEGMVEYTKQRAIDEGWRNVEVKVVDAQETNLPTDYYTHVFASFECLRVLQPGGTLAITTWKEIPWISILESSIKSLSPDLPFPDATEYHEIFNKGWGSEIVVHSRFEKAGFTDVRVTVVPAQVSLPIALLVELNKSILPALLGRFWTEEQRGEYEVRIPGAMQELLEEKYGVDEVVLLEPVAVIATGRKL